MPRSLSEVAFEMGLDDPAHDSPEVRAEIALRKQRAAAMVGSEDADAVQTLPMPSRVEERPRWAAPIPVTQLPDRGPAVDWILNGMIAVGHITLISALFKSGKTTFLSHLLRCLQHGFQFIGRETRECPCHNPHGAVVCKLPGIDRKSR